MDSQGDYLFDIYFIILKIKILQQNGHANKLSQTRSSIRHISYFISSVHTILYYCKLSMTIKY